ncbi:hypothetical protein [Ralstonia chuxiongensis]|nr:hypothetical protein [Ralstonia chuxiongensis]
MDVRSLLRAFKLRGCAARLSGVVHACPASVRTHRIPASSPGIFITHTLA